jgi:hypothetical protein
LDPKRKYEEGFRITPTRYTSPRRSQIRNIKSEFRSLSPKKMRVAGVRRGGWSQTLEHTHITNNNFNNNKNGTLGTLLLALAVICLIILIILIYFQAERLPASLIRDYCVNIYEKCKGILHSVLLGVK